MEVGDADLVIFVVELEEEGVEALGCVVHLFKFKFFIFKVFYVVWYTC